MFVNYDDCILNVVASIRNYFGLESSYAANPYFDEYLKTKKPRQIIIALVDGMGAKLIDRKLPQDGFFKKHLLFSTSTVFPTTTTAATTAIQNGRSPNENGWIGWSQYFKEVDDFIVPFLGKGYYSKKDYGADYVYKKIPVSTTKDDLIAKGLKADEIYPAFRPDGAKDIEDFVAKIKAASYGDDSYIYAYWDEYDSLMHKEGVDNKLSDDYLKRVQKAFAEGLKDLDKGTLVVIVADHGLVDIKEEINVYETPLNDYLLRPTCVEPRSTVFYVKEGQKEAFAKTFKELYEDDFILLSKEEVLASHLLGDHENHPRLDDFIGDFMAIGKHNKHFVYNAEPADFKFKGAHAGCHIDELLIPVITYMDENKKTA